jgi:Family of unknown function (DUF6101)
MEAGRIAAGSGQAGGPCRADAAGTSEPSERAGGPASAPRLDPFSLPVRFTAADQAADAQLRVVDLHRERVVLRRSVRGMRMALNLPVAGFRGVAIRLIGETGQMPSAIAVVLEHADPALSLPLFAAHASDDVIAEWQAWGRVLGLPLLVAEGDGSLREPLARLGALRVEAPIARRRRRGAIARRRPVRLLRRKATRLSDTPAVHRGELEIIARH